MEKYLIKLDKNKLKNNQINLENISCKKGKIENHLEKNSNKVLEKKLIINETVLEKSKNEKKILKDKNKLSRKNVFLSVKSNNSNKEIIFPKLYEIKVNRKRISNDKLFYLEPPCKKKKILKFDENFLCDNKNYDPNLDKKKLLQKNQQIIEWLTSKKEIIDGDYWILKSSQLSKELIQVSNELENLENENELLICEYKEIKKLYEKAIKLGNLLKMINS